MRKRPLLARRLKRIREDAGLSQRDLAAASGIHYTTIARIETGEVSEPEDATVESLAQALGCSADALGAKAVRR